LKSTGLGYNIFVHTSKVQSLLAYHAATFFVLGCFQQKFPEINYRHDPWKFEANRARTFWVMRFFIERPLPGAGYAIFFKQLRCNQMWQAT